MSLLTENYQKIVKREKILRLSVYFIFLLSFAGILGFIFMLPSYFLLSFSKDDYLRKLQIEEEILARRELGKLETEILKVNEMIGTLDMNEKKRHGLSGVLIRLFRATPQDIRIFNLGLEREKTGQFVLGVSGNASTREYFLKYAAFLESSPDFSEVVSPITNLLSESNVEFNIKLKIKPEVYGL